MMNERERLIELLNKSCEVRGWLMNGAGTIADYLLENGVVVLSRDGNGFNKDLYCPYCGNNLSNTRFLEQALKGGNEE